MDEKIKNLIPKTSIQSLVSYRPKVKDEIEKNQIRLSVNEGALGPGPKASDAIKQWYENFPHHFHRYPVQVNQDLVSAIAKRYNLNSENIVPGNGSDELIQLLCNAFIDYGDEAIHTQYGFLVFPQCIKISGGTPIVAKDKNLTVSVDAVLKKISKKTKIIFLANPNNPTGTMIPEKDLVKLIQKLPKNIVLVIDSAYAEYVLDKNYVDGSEFVEKYENIVMLRTFSKIHGLASFRLGWAYSSAYITSILKSIRAPFSVNSIAGFVGCAAISDKEFQERSAIHNFKMMEWTREKLNSAKIKVHFSVANFFLIEFNTINKTKKALEYLEKKNIFVREMAPYNLANFIRVSIGNEKEMTIFCNEIVNFMSEDRL